MKTQRLNVMLSDRRMNKLQQLALEKDKTMTQIIEELLDGAPEPTWTAPKGAAHSSHT